MKTSSIEKGLTGSGVAGGFLESLMTYRLPEVIDKLLYHVDENY